MKISLEERYLKEVPSFADAEDVEKVEGVKSIYYKGPDHKGRPTRVFAYLGLPEGASAKQKVPAMVLVHGGSGTAFSDWVKLWTSRGYAAIAMDTCGCIPRHMDDGKSWIRIPDGGPAGWGASFKTVDDPLVDRWPYYAQNAIACARTLLGSLPEVDDARIGITGISWGGYLTCIAAALDKRYAFAVPVYGCGFLLDSCPTWITEGMKADWSSYADPSNYLADAAIPFLWVTGTNDFAFPMESLTKSYGLVRSPVSLCVRVRMPHGHGGAGENPEEIRAFADHFLKGGAPLAELGRMQVSDTGVATVSCNSKRPLRKAELVYTTDTPDVINSERFWRSVPADISPDGGEISAKLPSGVRLCYFNVEDKKGLVSSSRFEALKPSKDALVDAYSTRLVPGVDSWVALVPVKNLTDKPLEGSFVLTAQGLEGKGELKASLKPNSPTVLKFPVKPPKSGLSDARLSVSINGLKFDFALEDAKLEKTLRLGKKTRFGKASAKATVSEGKLKLDFEVQDSTPSKWEKSLLPWSQDCIELFFDAAPDEVCFSRFNNYTENVARLFVIPHAPEGGRLVKWPGKLDFSEVAETVKTSADGYSVSVSLPLTAFGKNAPQTLGFDLQVDDLDNGELRKWSWNSSGDAYCNRMSFGYIVLD